MTSTLKSFLLLRCRKKKKVMTDEKFRPGHKCKKLISIHRCWHEGDDEKDFNDA